MAPRDRASIPLERLLSKWHVASRTQAALLVRAGRVTVDGHDFLVASLSDGNSTKAKGISLVEAAAKAAVKAMAADGSSASPSAS